MSALLKEDMLSKTLWIALFVGIMTILIVLNVGQSNNYLILSVGYFLGNSGNLLFLIISNVLIIGWAWRKHLSSVIKLTLGVDLTVLALVQGIKQLDLGSWSIRPYGPPNGFPSGHTTHAFAMAFILTFFFPRFAWLWYLCATAISWSRLETSFHSGLQIVAGIILGTGIAWLLVSRWLRHADATVVIKSHNLAQSRSL